MIAAPAPWITRKKIIQASAMSPVGVAPHSAEAPANMITPIVTMRRCPAMSARRPPRANSADSESRYAFTIHCVPVADSAEVLLQLRHGERDDRLVDERHRDGEDHRRQDQPAAAAVAHPRQDTERPSGHGLALPWRSLASPRRGRDLGRIAAFTDGVMAVAITLLVLNIEVPTLEPGQSLGDALVDLLPSLGAYVLAFALVGPLLGDPPQPVREAARLRPDADGAQPLLPRADRAGAVLGRAVRRLHERGRSPPPCSAPRSGWRR